MKVLYVYDEMPGIYQRYLWHTLKAVKAYTPVDSLSYQEHSDATFNINQQSLQWKWHRLKSKLKLEKQNRLDMKIFYKYDIIHLQHSYLFRKFEGFKNLPRHTRPKFIVTLRGADTYIKPWEIDEWRQFYKNSEQWVDAFVVMTNHQKQYLTKWGVPADRIHVIPISLGKEHLVAKHKEPNKEKIKIVSVFRLCWEKNIEGNIRTIKELAEENIPVRYDIYGDGPDSGQIPYLIDKYNLKGVVFYMGKSKNEDILRVFSSYDFILQLSHSESFGMSIVEAQSRGLPALVSNSDGMPEVIRHNETGYNVDPWDAPSAAKHIKELHANTKKYTEFSKNAIQFVGHNFTTNYECEKLINLYKKTI